MIPKLQWGGGKYRHWTLPTVIDPPRKCVCFEIPDDEWHVRAFWSAIYRLTYWNNWSLDEAKTGKEVAAVWKDVWYKALTENEDFMGCGCDQENSTRIFRFDEDGRYQYSDDNGETWNNATGTDPRYTAPLMPPQTYPPGADPRCAAAENIVTTYKQSIDATVVKLREEASLTEVMLAFLAIILFLLSAGSGAIIIGLIFAGFTQLIGYGADAIEAAMTAAAYEEARCLIFCHLEDDGTITESNYFALLDEIGSLANDVMRISLTAFVRAAGAKGLINAGRAGTGTGESCDCQCFSCQDAPIVTVGTLLESGRIQSVAVGGQHWVELYFGSTTNPNDACEIISHNDQGAGTQTYTGKIKGSDVWGSQGAGGMEGKCLHAVRLINIFGQSFNTLITRQDCP